MLLLSGVAFTAPKGARHRALSASPATTRTDFDEWKQGAPAGNRRGQYKAPAGDSPTERPGEIFGQNVFTKAVLQQRLPKAVFKSVMATIEQSKPLDPTVADVVASSIAEFAGKTLTQGEPATRCASRRSSSR